MNAQYVVNQYLQRVFFRRSGIRNLKIPQRITGQVITVTAVDNTIIATFKSKSAGNNWASTFQEGTATVNQYGNVFHHLFAGTYPVNG